METLEFIIVIPNGKQVVEIEFPYPFEIHLIRKHGRDNTQFKTLYIDGRYLKINISKDFLLFDYEKPKPIIKKHLSIVAENKDIFTEIITFEFYGQRV